MGDAVAQGCEPIGGEVTTDRLWDVNEVAEFLGMAGGSIYHLLSARKIPCVRLSARCVRFDPEVIKAWVAQHSEEPEGLDDPRRVIRNGGAERRSKKQKAA